MKRNSQHSKLNNIKSYLLQQVTFSHQSLFVHCFEDKDGNGSIDKEELMSLMQTLGKDVSADIVEDLMMILDTDGNGTVDFLVPNCTLSGLLL